MVNFDNVDKCIDTQDGQNQLHGGFVVVFQANVGEREIQPIWHDADLTSTTLQEKAFYGNSAIQVNYNLRSHAVVAIET